MVHCLSAIDRPTHKHTVSICIKHTRACIQLFGTCGGCQYQHMSVPAQRAWKRQHVEEVLTRTGNITGADMRPVSEVFGTQEVLGYRSKITPHHEKPRSVSPSSTI